MRKTNLKKSQLIFTIFTIILVFTCLAALRWVFSPEHLKRVIISKLEDRLDKKVNIENISIRLLSNLRLFNMTVSSHIALEKTPFLKLKEINIDYSLSSLLKKKIDKITVVEPYIWFEDSQSDTYSGNSLRSAGVKRNRLSSFLRPSNIVVTNAHLVRTDKPSFEISNLNIEAENISKINSTFETIYYMKLEIGKAKYENFNADNIKAGIVYKKDVFNIKKIDSEIYEGTAKGEGEIKFQDGKIAYQFTSEIKKLDLKEFCKNNIPPRYKVTGIVNGYISISTDKSKPQQLEGEFVSVNSGGTVNAETFQLLMVHMPEGTLKDTLTSIFGKSEDFVYDEGRMKLGLLDGDILIKLFLKGPKGKFSFDIDIENEVVQSFLSNRL